MFSMICVWINGWENNREAGDLRRHRAHYYVIVIKYPVCVCECEAVAESVSTGLMQGVNNEKSLQACYTTIRLDFCDGQHYKL